MVHVAEKGYYYAYRSSSLLRKALDCLARRSSTVGYRKASRVSKTLYQEYLDCNDQYMIGICLKSLGVQV